MGALRMDAERHANKLAREQKVAAGLAEWEAPMEEELNYLAEVVIETFKGRGMKRGGSRIPFLLFWGVA